LPHDALLAVIGSAGTEFIIEVQAQGVSGGGGGVRVLSAVRVFRQNVPLEDASGSHTCCRQSIQQSVTEFMVSDQGCQLLPHLLA
jgi:hypothetical protein